MSSVFEELKEKFSVLECPSKEKEITLSTQSHCFVIFSVI